MTSQQSGQPRSLGLQGLGLAAQANEMMLEEGHMSDTTASAPGSDDEVGSNAATDGSTLRTSPAEHAGSAGSESGGSAVDSISGEIRHIDESKSMKVNEYNEVTKNKIRVYK